jgi:hypothetical protein
MQVATTTPQTSRGLLAICSNIVKVSAVLALRKVSLSPVNSTLMVIWLRLFSLNISRDIVFC